MKGNIVHLYLVNLMDSFGLTEYEFFDLAYLARFGKVGATANDAAQYRLHGIIPKYVEWYIQQHQQESATCSSSAPSATAP
jgi:hypothetical protein